MTKVVWLKRVVNHLQQIYDYYAETNEKRAFQIISEISESVHILKLFSAIGQLLEGDCINISSYRSLIVYKCLYRVVCMSNEFGCIRDQFSLKTPLPPALSTKQ